MKKGFGLLERDAREVAGVFGCFERLVVTGTLTEVAHPEATDNFLHREGFRAFDIGRFADPLRGRIRDNAAALAQAAGIEIENSASKARLKSSGLVQLRCFPAIAASNLPVGRFRSVTI